MFFLLEVSDLIIVTAIFLWDINAITNILHAISMQHYAISMQDCSNSIANALELLQSCTKPSICLIGLKCDLTVRQCGQPSITLLPAQGDNPLQLGEPRGSRWWGLHLLFRQRITIDSIVSKAVHSRSPHGSRQPRLMCVVGFASDSKTIEHSILSFR